MSAPSIPFRVCLALLVGAGPALVAQPVTQPPAIPIIQTAPAGERNGTEAEAPSPRFDFEFRNLPLINAIEQVQETFHKRTGRYLNVVVPGHLRELAETNALTLDVKQVTVGELLKLLGMASRRVVSRIAGYQGPLSGPMVPSFSPARFGYDFALVSAGDGNSTYLLEAEVPTDAPEPRQPAPSVSSAGPQPTPEPEGSKVVQFYQLEPYLNRYKIEDITTAVKTGWDLAGFRTKPTLKFHEETKLLVVSGEMGQVVMVEQVLRNLASGRTTVPRIVPGGQVPAAVPAPTTSQPALPVPPSKP